MALRIQDIDHLLGIESPCAYSDHAGHPFRVMRDTIPIDAGHLCVIKLPFMI